VGIGFHCCISNDWVRSLLNWCVVGMKEGLLGTSLSFGKSMPYLITLQRSVLKQRIYWWPQAASAEKNDVLRSHEAEGRLETI
jgi:hypothetical protein